MKFNTSKIIKAFNEDLKLIYYQNKNGKLSFYVLGNSDNKDRFIYLVSIVNKILGCNCENFADGYFCKHICFVLFRCLKIFNYNFKKNIISLVKNSTLEKTNFFTFFLFTDDEWSELIIRFNLLGNIVKSNIFLKNDFNRFFILISSSKLLLIENKDCAICLESNHYLIKCNKCNNTYHIECLLIWYENKEVYLCPICKDKYFEDKLINMYLISNKKIPYYLYNNTNKKIEII